MDQLKKIATEIVRHNNEIRNNDIINFSLLTGYIGEVFFLYYYSLIEHEYESIADEFLERLLNNISIRNNNSSYYSYCNGLAGLGIALHLLEESGFIQESTEILDDVDLLLEHGLFGEIKIQHFDFLHGIIGIGFYFLKHYKYCPEKSLPQLKKILIYLEETAIIEQDQIKWKAIDILKQRENGLFHADFNISLSHGISSIIIFLCRYINLNITGKERAENMLNMAVNYVLKQRIDTEKYGSYFPGSSIESSEIITKSRLAWCYGDPGIALALWHTSKILKREDLYRLSIEVLLYSSKRRNLSEAFIYDAGICHGSAGISQIYFRMYEETQMIEFKETYKYWTNVTKKMAYHKDGLAGYKTLHDKEWINNYSILDGVAGIGLSMLSPVNADWDEILLLNFK